MQVSHATQRSSASRLNIANVGRRDTASAATLHHSPITNNSRGDSHLNATTSSLRARLPASALAPEGAKRSGYVPFGIDDRGSAMLTGALRSRERAVMEV